MKQSYPWLALGLGLLLGLILMRFGTSGSAGDGELPLLTTLFIAEFGLLVTAIAAAMCIRDLLRQGIQILPVTLLVGNSLLSVHFLWTIILQWPDVSGA